MTAHDYTTFAEPLAHPGAHLREDFLPDYGLTPGALARAMGLKDRTRIERVVREQQPVTSDTALRLARVFGTTMGHYNHTMSDPVYLDLITRGTLWATGKLQEDGSFLADTVLAKHDENYMPRELADSLKEKGVKLGKGAEEGAYQ